MIGQMIMSALVPQSAPPPSFDWGFVNNAATAGTGATTKTTAGVTTQSGDTFIIFVPDDDAPTGVSDNKGNGYTLIGSVGTKRLYISQGATTGGAGHTFSATFSSTAWCAIYGVWVRGVGSYDAGSINAYYRNMGQPWWTNNITFAQANNLLLLFLAPEGGAGSEVFTYDRFGTGPDPQTISSLTASSDYWPAAIAAADGSFGLTGYSVDIFYTGTGHAYVMTLALPKT